MKKLFRQSIFSVLFFALSLLSCRKESTQPVIPALSIQPQYSTIAEFRQGMQQVVNMIQANGIIAYLDTLPNGYPNIAGSKIPLSQFGYSIINKLNGTQQQIQEGVYDVFHFDGATFSLISFIMKAQMVGDITPQTMVDIQKEIPLPPIVVPGFTPPVGVVALGGGDCCKDNPCDPKLAITVTWTYKAPCGNYERTTSGYAAGNTLTGMPSGTAYRFNAEITGCPCPGELTSTVTGPAGASLAVGKGKDGSVTLFPASSGTYTITFTYKVCDKTVTKTFTLIVK